MIVISYSLATVAFFFVLPVVLFLIEVIAAVALPPRVDLMLRGKDSGQRIAVLVPAHNESSALLPTLADIQEQLRPTDRLVVVADNCSDDTAAVATKAGADVVVRNDRERMGKGYALAHGLDYLSALNPDIVIVIDADCRLSAHTLDHLTAACAATHRPVQALNLMIAPVGSSMHLKVAEFAWRVKNWVRPLGLRALGQPCQLMGTGMAFPWDLIRSVNLASGSIVEDLKLGHDMALAGYPPVFCPSAAVTSVFPSSAAGVQSQRLRWEHGHIGLIFSSAPELICAALTRAKLQLLALALDLLVPPLSLLAMLVIAVSAVSGIAAVLGLSSTAMLLSAVNLAGFAGGIFISWLKFGRDVLPPTAVWSVVPYMAGKLILYGKIFSRKPGPQWIRTDRRTR